MIIWQSKSLFTGCCLKKFSFSALALFLIIFISSCGGTGKFRTPEPIPGDQAPVSEPQFRSINIPKNGFEKLITDQIEQSFDLSRQLRNLSGRRKQAINIDAFGEVANSSWFINQNGAKRMSIAEISRGPNSGEGPDTSRTWTVVGAKAEGVTPGFTIQDSRGDRYVIKFDPMGYSELATGAEVVCTKLFHAAGYHVPENYIVYFHPRILKLGEEVSFTDKKGRKRFMNPVDLDEILERIERLPDGHLRAVASKFISGFKGPFKYKGTRKDDPNDMIAHQHRRELRGLRVIAAWLNHYDTKDNNTGTAYTDEGYVKHYLLEFGSTLGSQGDEPMPPEIGHENATVDAHQLLKNIVTLGFYVRPWEKVKPIRYPSIGYFRSDIFHPQKYKFILPNPAFELMTNLDGYWGAKIVMSFTDEQLEAAVAEGQYSDPEAANYLLRLLIERREIVGRYWFSRMNPLDRFELQQTPDGTHALCFVDLAVETGLESAAESRYRYDVRRNGDFVIESQVLGETCLPLPGGNGQAEPGADETQWEVKIQTRRNSNGKWSKWVKVYLGSDNGAFSLLGVRRQE